MARGSYNRKFGVRTDATQKAIVAALRGVGCTVKLTTMVGAGFADAVVWSPFTRSCHLLEMKTLTGKLTPAEQDFHATWPGPIAIVRSIDEALVAVGVRPIQARAIKVQAVEIPKDVQVSISRSLEVSRMVGKCGGKAAKRS